MRPAIRKHRGDRTAIVAKIPDVMAARVDEERARYGATRVDYLWHVLAHHFGMPELDPLADPPETQMQLPGNPGSPTRAA